MRLHHYFGLHDPFSSLSHLLAAVAVLGGGYFLYLRGRGHALRTGALLLFSLSLLFLFSMSGVYHGLPPGPWRVFFRRLDYAGIWIVIAGSATPVHLLMLKGRWRWGMITLFWCVALTCLVLIDCYFAQLPYWAIVSAYVGCSLLGLISFMRIIESYGWRETTLLTWGGVAYIAGAVIDTVDAPIVLSGVIGPHELFHIAVILGACLHWIFIYNRADRPLHFPVLHKTSPEPAPLPPAEPA